MIDLCSHKRFLESYENYDCAILLYQTEDQLEVVKTEEGFNEEIDILVQKYLSGQPEENNYGLPELSSVLAIIEFVWENKDKRMLICDVNGKGPCSAIAVIKETWNLGGVRAAVKSSESYKHRPIDLFFLMLVDALIKTSFAQSVLNFTQEVKYQPIRLENGN